MKKIFLNIDNFINKYGFSLYIVYKFLLEIIYVKIINPIFFYNGFYFNFNILKYIIFWVIYFIFYFFIRKNLNMKKPSNSIVTILFFVSFVPALVLFSFLDINNIMFILFLIYWAVLIFLNFYFPQFKIKYPNYQTCKIVTYIFISYFSLIIIYISFKYTGFRLNFNLFNVYTLRTEALSYQLPSILLYSFAAAKVFLPISFVYFLSNKKRLLGMFIFFIQFLAFSIDGSKSTLFSIILIYLCYKFYQGIPNKIFYFGIVNLTLISLLEFLFLKKFYLINFLIRRLMFIPNLLHVYYYDFFSINEKDYFRQGIIGRFGLNSPYTLDITKMIGKLYFNDENMIANNGLFSDAYYNLGSIGVFILPILLIIMLRFMDSTSKGIKNSILISVIITSAYTIISSSFFTVMLTHGFLIICISLYFLPRKKSRI